jgi:hypothetical protein
VDFDTRGYGGNALGSYGKHTVVAWDGEPKPKLGERWECEVFTVWDSGEQRQGLKWGSGMLVRPLRLLNPYPMAPMPVKNGQKTASNTLSQRGNSRRA